MIQQVEELTEDMVSILYHLHRHNKRRSIDFLLVLPHCNQQTFSKLGNFLNSIPLEFEQYLPSRHNTNMIISI
jgi:hypothetical protein